jgi:internalin A
MESCGICFRVRELPNDEWEYIAPELLPQWSDAQEQLLGRLRDDPPDAEATAQYTFLHEGILRGYLSKLGEYAKDAAIYWKYGCWFYEQKTRSQVLIESGWDDAESEAGAGDIRLRAWGERADHLVYKLLKTLESLPVGQPPEISLTPGKAGASSASIFTRPIRDSQRGKAVPLSETRDEAEDADYLQISSRPELPPKSTPEIFVSYAWGDDSSEDARKRTEIVDRLCERMDKHGWNIIRDKANMRSGDLISGFMTRIGLADHVIVVLSDKYLRSPYCMTELHYIYQRSLGEKEDFLRRIIPLALEDARFGNRRDRLVYAEHWKQEFQSLNEDLRDENRRLLLGREDFADFKAMQQWYPQVSDILRYMNDVLHPHGFDQIVKDDFAALRQMLQHH